MSALRKKAEVARYLGKDSSEIDRMMEDDGLPYIKPPGATKPSIRFELGSFYKWLMKYDRGTGLTYEDFVRAFDEAQKKVLVSSDPSPPRL